MRTNPTQAAVNAALGSLYRVEIANIIQSLADGDLSYNLAYARIMDYIDLAQEYGEQSMKTAVYGAFKDPVHGPQRRT